MTYYFLLITSIFFVAACIFKERIFFTNNFTTKLYFTSDFTSDFVFLQVVISKKESMFSWDETTSKVPARLTLQVRIILQVTLQLTYQLILQVIISLQVIFQERNLILQA